MEVPNAQRVLGIPAKIYIILIKLTKENTTTTTKKKVKPKQKRK
jgi:hypothetical protein